MRPPLGAQRHNRATPSSPRYVPIVVRRFVIAALVIFSCAASAQQMSGVVTDGVTVAAPDPDGGIQAINMSDGKVTWQSKTASWPIGFGGGKIVALTDPGKNNGLQVAFFDPDTGRNTAMVGPVQLVSWAKPKYGFEHNSDFNVWIASKWGDGMVLYWRAERWSPITLGNYKQPQTKQMAGGRILIGFARNSVEAHQIPPPSEPAAPRDPEKGLPLLKGQKAISTMVVGGRTLALIKTRSDLSVACFQDQLLLWSKVVATK